MNEHDNLTPAEMESYRSALKEAYPAPKTDIHANVMKQIRAERLAQKQRMRRAAFVKWGSVAACLLLVCIIAIRVVPGMDKLAAAEADNAGAMAEDISVARYDIRDNDAVSHEEVNEKDYNFPADDGQTGATTPSYDPNYGYSAEVEDNVEVPADDAMNTPSVEFPEAEAPAADDVMAETEETEEPEIE